jgi:hypothetical protein
MGAAVLTLALANMKKTNLALRSLTAVFILTGLLAIQMLPARAQAESQSYPRWSVERAAQWHEKHPWLVGCNFIPSTAINQLEMWQADTFDPATLDRELGWAQKLGFNSLRVFLHPIAYQEDEKGFISRMNEFLKMAHRQKIGIVFVLFDSCWNPICHPGKQPAPTPFTHNSGWVQSPGAAIISDANRLDEMKPFVLGVVGHFAKDERIDAWDIYNEPDNNGGGNYDAQEPVNKLENTTILLKKAFAWAREVNPTQPLTSGVWQGNWSGGSKTSDMAKLQFAESDIISFHCYGPLVDMMHSIDTLKKYGRPLVCTEYMARPVGSTFDPILGYMRDQQVGAFNWGFVSGKTQTIFPWDSWTKHYTAEPPVWFHDIFHTDGTPYHPTEVEYIRRVTSRSDR